MKLDELESALRERQAGRRREQRIAAGLALAGVILGAGLLWALFQFLASGT